jgi:autotransporter-associated beta strand protein
VNEGRQRDTMLMGRTILLAAVACLLAGSPPVAEATPVTRTVGPFNITFYNRHDSDGSGIRGAQNWTQQQMDDVAACAAIWADRLTNTPGRQAELHLFWYAFSGTTLGATNAPTNGDGTNSWTYVEHIWRDGTDYEGPWTRSDCTFQFDTNAASTSWNFGTGAPTSGQIDFRTVITHELGHALGFCPSYSSSNDSWGNCWGTASSPSGYAGQLGLANWDRLLVDDAGNHPANAGTGTPGNFNQVANPVWFAGANAAAYYGGNVPVYAPNPYQSGSSLSHLDETRLPNALMSPSLAPGQVVRQPTRLEWEMMKDLGWSVLTTKTWTKGAGTLSWADAANWDPNGGPDATWDVTLDGAGLADGDVMDIAGNQSVNILTIDSGAGFTIGGPSGTLTIARGRMTRTAASLGAQVISRPVALGAGAVWDIGGAGQMVVSGAISGSGFGIEKRGEAALVLSGTSTYSGVTAIKAGALVVGANAPSGSAGALGSATSSILLGDTAGAADAALLIGGPYTVGRSVVVQAGGTGNVTLGGTNASATATFAGNVSLARSAVVTAAAGGTVGFAGTVSGVGGLTKTGEGTVILSGTTSYSGVTTVQAGTLTISGPQTHGTGAALVVGGGAVNLDSDAGAAGIFNLTVNVSGGGAARFGATQHLAALNLSGGAAQLAPGGGKVIVTGGLGIDTANNSTLDLAEGDLIVHFSGGGAGECSPTLLDVQRWIISAHAGGAWTGTGITSTFVAGYPDSLGLGYAQNDLLDSPFSEFAGEAVDGSTVLVKPAYLGDLDLDGDVDLDDLALLGNYWDPGHENAHTWWQGDVNYDGWCDLDDLIYLSGNWQLGVGDPLGSGPGGAAPEPATLALVALGALAAAAHGQHGVGKRNLTSANYIEVYLPGVGGSKAPGQ